MQDARLTSTLEPFLIHLPYLQHLTAKINELYDLMDSDLESDHVTAREGEKSWFWYQS
jgi:hypothetical protein